MQWTELNDYIYVPDATGQRLMATDIFRRSQNELLVLGYELHYEDDLYVEDPPLSTYIYNESTNILTKVADNLRDAISVYVAENFDRGVALYPSAKFRATGIVSEYIYDLIVVTVTGGGIGTSGVRVLDCTFFLKATTSGYKVLWDTYTSGLYFEMWTASNGTQAFCYFFPVMVKLPTSTILIRYQPTSAGAVAISNISESYLYQNTGLNLRTRGSLGWTTLRYLHRPTSVYTYYKITPFGIEPYLEEVTETIPVYNPDTNTNDLVTIYYNNTTADIRYYGGTKLLSERRIKQELVGTNITFTVTRLLRDPYGANLDTETGGAEILGGHACTTRETEETFYMLEYLTHKKKVRDFYRYANNLYAGTPPGNKCNDPLWRSYTLPPGWTWAGPYGRFYIWNTGLVFSIYYTDFPDNVFGHVTFLGADRAWLSFIDKNTNLEEDIAPTQGLIGYALQDNIYVMTVADGIIKLDWRLGLQAKPSSITTFEDIDNKYLTIGGRSYHPRQLEEATFFEDGEEVEPERVLQYYKNSALYIRVNVPDLTSSGVLAATTRVDVVSPDGESLVKHRAGGTLVHGDILPHRLLYVTPYMGYEDWSYNLPSGTSTSVDFMGDTVHISLGNKVYKLVGSGWQEVFTTTPITTALITENDYIFVGHSGTSPNVHKYFSSIEQADFGLPDGLIVLDLEEEYYADR